MVITIVCQCGRKHRAQDWMIGSVIVCDHCGQSITIPEAKTTVDEPAPDTTVLPANDDPIDGPVDDSDSDLPSDQCPKCHIAMPSDAVLCVECGFHRKLNRQFQSQQSDGKGVVNLGTLVTQFPDATPSDDFKFSQELRFRKERSWDGQGFAIYLVAIVCIAFLDYVAARSGSITVMIAVVSLSLVPYLTGKIWVTVLAWQEHALHGVFCLLCDLYAFYYSWTNWDECEPAFYLLLVPLASHWAMGIVIFAILPR